MDVLFRGGANCAVIDPVTIVSAMAAVTKSVSFGITGSTSYIGKHLTQLEIKSRSRSKYKKWAGINTVL